MYTISNGYRSLSLLVGLNWDRVLFVAVIFGALMAGAHLGKVL
ncbi:MAG: hypothetical protein SWN98_14075 [Pseudomonadota bacterium]|nr:hypothetical protein [Actibacterium sp.]MDY6860454.1 hypothetical protein [Pseudomonadota bacterium]